jgi:hypothetical protein
METTPPIQSDPRISGMEILGYIGLAVMAVCAAIYAIPWIKDSERQACILNIRNVQQAVQGHMNMNSFKIEDPIDWHYIFGPDGYLPKPICPGGGTYTFAIVDPGGEKFACTCSHADHVPPIYAE